MLFSTPQINRIHKLGNPSTSFLPTSHKVLERVKSCKVLNIIFTEMLKWNEHDNKVTQLSYLILRTLPYFKRIACYSITKTFITT